jgi:hypothetical protein
MVQLEIVNILPLLRLIAKHMYINRKHIGYFHLAIFKSLMMPKLGCRVVLVLNRNGLCYKRKWTVMQNSHEFLISMCVLLVIMGMQKWHVLFPGMFLVCMYVCRYSF